jgi:ATP-dependent DNA ligase
MLCKTSTELDIIHKNNKWLFQQKIDGCRCLAICFNGNVALKGRNGTDFTKKFPEVVEELKKYNGSFDGELVCDTFEHTLSRVHTENSLKSSLLVKEYPAVFHIFDIIEVGTLKTRVELLKSLNLVGKHISLLDYTFDGVGLWNRVKEQNLEGVIIKNPESEYAGFCKVRSNNWLKVKNIKSEDIVFHKFEDNPAGIRVESDKGIAIQISGSNAVPIRKQILETGSALIEVNYLNKTDKNMLRMCVFKCLKQ